MARPGRSAYCSMVFGAFNGFLIEKIEPERVLVSLNFISRDDDARLPIPFVRPGIRTRTFARADRSLCTLERHAADGAGRILR